LNYLPVIRIFEMCKKLRTSGNLLLCFALGLQRANARPLERALTRFGKSWAAVDRRFGNTDALDIYGRLQVISSDFFNAET
jgi:hypothetical protein